MFHGLQALGIFLVNDLYIGDPPIIWKLRRCFVYGLKRAGGLGMILKLFSTRDLSLLAHANYRVKIC